MTKKAQRHRVFLFGLISLVALMVLAIAFSEPTPFQYTIFRVVLALATAGIAAMIPGFLEVNIPGWLRTGGSLAVFLVVYFYNPIFPAGSGIPDPEPTAEFVIHVGCIRDNYLVLDTFTLPYADIEKKSGHADFLTLLGQLPLPACELNDTIIYRLKDEEPVDAQGAITVTSGGNQGVLVLPAAFVSQIGDAHMAFTMVKSQLKDMQRLADATESKETQPTFRSHSKTGAIKKDE